MTTSLSPMTWVMALALTTIELLVHRLGRSRPRPRIPFVSNSISRNLPPSDLDLLLDDGPNVVGGDHRLPMRLAEAIACSPATPAPTTKTFAGAMVPPAVIIMGNIFGS